MIAPSCSLTPPRAVSPADWLTAAARQKCSDQIAPPQLEESLPCGPPPGLSSPPGLSWLGDESAESAPKRNAVALSLASLCAPGPEEKSNISSPPGLEGLLAPPGLGPPMEKGRTESDDTTAGGSSRKRSSESERDAPTFLVLAEVSALKATSPMFCPMLSPGTASLLMPDVAQQTPLRTKLRAKANLYVPGGIGAPLPFVPMAAVEESWQNWYAQNEYSAEDEYKYYAEQDTYNESVVDDINLYSGYPQGY